MTTTLHQSMLDKIIIIDFEDSFTYNIASVLFPFEQKLKVISHKDFFSQDFFENLKTNKKLAIVLGPGPGHPSEYQGYFSQIKNLREHSNIYLMGICLGHQILGLMDKKDIKEASHKVHGQCVEIEFHGKTRTVQRYNSLSVYEGNREVDVRIFDRGVSYQFHPESVGSDSPQVFFGELINFIRSH